jgi:hypothetical protein
VGVYNTHRSFYGGHTKTVNLQADLATDAREFAEEEAGLTPKEEREE